jgi:hypothetical protein
LKPDFMRGTPGYRGKTDGARTRKKAFVLLLFVSKEEELPDHPL